MNCLPAQLPPGKILMDVLCSLPRSLSPYMLSLFLVSQFSLGPSLYQGFCSAYSVCSAVVVFCSVCSTVGGLLSGSGGLLLRLGGLMICLACRGGPCSICSAVVGFCSVGSVRVSGSTHGSCSVGSALASCSAGSALVLCSAGSSSVSPLLHGPGPPSLPLFRLRSTALLDFTEKPYTYKCLMPSKA